MHKKIIVVAGFFFLFFIFGCGKPKTTDSSSMNSQVSKDIKTRSKLDLSPAYGDTIIETSISDAQILNPILYSDEPSGDIVGLVYNGLLKYDENLKLVGDLASTWEVSADGLDISFKLRKGVKWHDGVEFTADDVKFTYDKIMDPKTKSFDKNSFSLVKSVTVTGKYSLDVKYSKPFAPALPNWGIGIIPKHIFENEKDINKSKYNRQPIGTGPFKFVSWSPDEQIVLEANDDYFDGRPYFNRYVYKIIPDVSMAFTELKRGSIDIMSLTPDQFQKQANTEEFLNRFNVYHYPSPGGYTYIGYNQSKSLFKDVRLRKALTYAIDRQMIIDEILLGYGKILSGPFPPSSWAYDKTVTPFPYSPEKAKKLLAEAGWKDTDGDGILDKDGKPLEIEISTNNGNEPRRLAASLIKKCWDDIGVKTNLKFVEWGVLMKMCDYMKFDAMILGWTLGKDPDYYGLWHSSEIPDMVHGKEGNNFCAYINKETDTLWEEARTTYDIKKRTEDYHKLHRIIHDEQPYTFLYVAESIYAVDNRIHGIRIAPAGIFYNFEKWYVPKELQRY